MSAGECGYCGADGTPGSECICDDLCPACKGTGLIYCDCPPSDLCECEPKRCKACDDGLRKEK